MAKRELSNTLKNLKFMQRGAAAAAAAQKIDKPRDRENEVDKEKSEITSQDSPFGCSSSSSLPSRKCVVIMEGNPHPGAVRGRLSFGSFNPSIDKLNEAAVRNEEMGSSPSTSVRVEKSASRKPVTEPDSDLKRKKPISETESPSPSKLQKNKDGDTASQPSSLSENSGNKSRSSKTPSKRDKLDWNLLRPPRKP